MRSKLITAGLMTFGTMALLAAPAAAHECTNANKPAGAGAQVIIGPDDQIESATRGVFVRVGKGIIDADTGAGYHGLVGFDVDGDGTPEATTYIVGPNDEIPTTAQLNGSPNHGIVNICTLDPAFCEG
jgi:hypothetical protein